MEKENQKLLKLCLKSLNDKNLDEKGFSAFSKDYSRYAKGELMFRELIGAIKNPKGQLKEAMEIYYNKSAYSRAFKAR